MKSNYTFAADALIPDTIASGLSNLGIARNYKIAILSMNRNDYLTLYGGAATLGAIVVPTN